MNQIPTRKPLDIEGLRNYKKQNPAKFEHKFGKLDLDNLPENFNIEAHKAMILEARPKPVLLQSIGARPAEVVAPAPVAEPVVTPVEKTEEKVEDVNGGSTLETNETA